MAAAAAAARKDATVVTSDEEDSVDGVTDQQLNIFVETYFFEGGRTAKGGWSPPMKSIKPLIDAIDAWVLRPTLRRLCAAGGANDNGEVGCPRDWKNRGGLPRLKNVFVRKYDAGERNTLRAHTDQSHFTFNLALENPWDESDGSDSDEWEEEDGEAEKEEEVGVKVGVGAAAVRKEGNDAVTDDGSDDATDAATDAARDDATDVDVSGGQLFVCTPLPHTYHTLLTIHQSLARGAAPTLLFDLRYPPAALRGVGAATHHHRAATRTGAGGVDGVKQQQQQQQQHHGEPSRGAESCEHARVPVVGLYKLNSAYP